MERDRGKGTCIKFDCLHAGKKGVDEDTKEGIVRRRERQEKRNR